MKNLTLYLFFIGFFCFANDPIEISILTCAPGKEIYSVFGHSALRIIDHKNALDTVYNFGIFNFNTPNFTLKFISGDLQYRLGTQQTQNFITDYTQENRIITEQQLHLDSTQKQQLIEQLQFLHLPENRYYTYSFLQRNCATEIRDLLSSLGILFRKQQTAFSNRNLINDHLKKHLWFQFGTNLLLGHSLDTKIDTYQSMFLPQLLHNEIENATINGKKLLASKQILNSVKSKKDPDSLNWLSSPLIIFSLICMIALFWFPKPVIFAISLIIGTTGLFLLIIWIFSGHTEVKFNMNILWCNPLYLLYIPMLIKNTYYQIIPYTLLLCLVITILIWIGKIQSFDIGISPILVILCLLNFKFLKKHTIQTYAIL